MLSRTFITLVAAASLLTLGCISAERLEGTGGHGPAVPTPAPSVSSWEGEPRAGLVEIEVRGGTNVTLSFADPDHTTPQLVTSNFTLDTSNRTISVTPMPGPELKTFLRVRSNESTTLYGPLPDLRVGRTDTTQVERLVLKVSPDALLVTYTGLDTEGKPTVKPHLQSCERSLLRDGERIPFDVGTYRDSPGHLLEFRWEPAPGGGPNDCSPLNLRIRYTGLWDLTNGS